MDDFGLPALLWDLLASGDAANVELAISLAKAENISLSGFYNGLLDFLRDATVSPPNHNRLPPMLVFSEQIHALLSVCARVFSLALEEKPIPAIARIWRFFPALRLLEFNANGLLALDDRFLDLQRLVSLAITDNLLEVVPPQVAHLPNLRTLILTNNRIAALPSPNFCLPNLQRVILSGNPIYAEAELLQTAFPNARV